VKEERRRLKLLWWIFSLGESCCMDPVARMGDVCLQDEGMIMQWLRFEGIVMGKD
jgi:hypothetical protein